MCTCHQILVVSGLALEIASAVYAGIATYRIKSSGKLAGNDQKRPLKDQIIEPMNIWLVSLILLVLGVVLQGIAAF
jgi:heme O synthase-like polyprenyltransferase